MITCTRRLQFCAGHRVMGHESKCAHLHGHNYVVLLTARAVSEAQLDGIGRVVDFSVLKERIGGWIEFTWDHGMLLHEGDAAAMAAVAGFDEAMRPMRQKVATLPYNPTAENIARHLVEAVGPKVLAGTGVELVRAEVWETENCRAEYAKEG